MTTRVEKLCYTQDKEEMSPLHLLLCYYRKEDLIELVKDLIINGADVNSTAKKGEIELETVTSTSYTFSITGMTPLHLLIFHYTGMMNNMIDIVQLLLENGADINAKDEYGRTPLHIYLYQCYEKDKLRNFAQFLVERGADVNAKDNDGETPLHYLCQYYKYDENYKKDNMMKDIAQFLIENGADVNAKDKRGRNPLFNLCEYYDCTAEMSDKERTRGLKDLVYFFVVHHDAEVHQKDLIGNTAPNLARQRGFWL